MNNITPPFAGYQTVVSEDSASSESNFDNKVLTYIKQHRPQGTLDDLLASMKALSPDKPVTMHQLNRALLYADTTLRNSEDFKSYTDEVLDKRASQLVGVKMFYDNMLYNDVMKTDNDN